MNLLHSRSTLNAKMPGKLQTWPDWPEFTAAKGEAADDLLGFKKAIVDKYSKDNIVKTWLRVCKELESLTERIDEQGTSVIPEVQYDEMFEMAPERKQELKDVGCFVVRGVFERDQADKWFADLKEYVASNRSSIGGKLFLALPVIHCADDLQVGQRTHLSY